MSDIELNAADDIGATKALENEFKKANLLNENLNWLSKSNHRELFSDEFIADNIQKESFRKLVEDEVMKIREEKLKRLKDDNS